MHEGYGPGRGETVGKGASDGNLRKTTANSFVGNKVKRLDDSEVFCRNTLLIERWVPAFFGKHVCT